MGEKTNEDIIDTFVLLNVLERRYESLEASGFYRQKLKQTAKSLKKQLEQELDLMFEHDAKLTEEGKYPTDRSVDIQRKI